MSDRICIEKAREKYFSALDTKVLGQNFLLLEETDSTNACIRRTEQAQGLAVVALRQSAGRGRLGRVWESEGDGLYLSFAVITAAENLTKLPLAAAVAAVEALEDAGIDGAGIKWPNDILISGKKIAGILCQAWGNKAAVGIGVNVGQSADFFKNAGLPNGASLAMLGYEADMWTLAGRIITNAERCISLIESGNYDHLLKKYRRLCLSLGREVEAIGAAETVRGIASDVDESGRLVIDTEKGRISVDSGEVKLRTPKGYI